MTRLIILSLLLLGGPAWAQSITPADWAGDPAALLAAIDSIHPAPYRHHTRAEFERAANVLEATLPGMSYGQAVAGFARMVGLLEDGHSRMGHVQLPSHAQPTLVAMDGPGFNTTFPVRFEFFADGLFVTEVAPEYRALLGGHVTHIAGRPAREAGLALLPLIATDNDAWRFYLWPEYLRHPGYLNAAGLLPEVSSPLLVTVARLDGTSITEALVPVDRTQEPALLDARAGGPVPLWQSFERNFDYRYLADRDVLYVRFQEVQAERDESVRQFTDRLTTALDTLTVSRTIMDVRRNGGGNNYLNQPLVLGLLRSPKLRQPGSLVVLTDRGTFSAAISLIADLEKNFWAVFLGEPSGSPVNQYGDPARITLPGSGLLVRLSTLYWQPSDPRDARSAILPDELVVPTFADWLAGRDPVLEAALAFDAGPVRWGTQPNENWARPAQRGSLNTGVQW